MATPAMAPRPALRSVSELPPDGLGWSQEHRSAGYSIRTNGVNSKATPPRRQRAHRIASIPQHPARRMVRAVRRAG